MPISQPKLWDADDRAVARATNPPTSWEAAESVTDITGKQQKILQILELFGPETDEEIYIAAKEYMSPSGARTRRAELVAKGLVEKLLIDGIVQTRATASGRKSIVWKAT